MDTYEKKYKEALGWMQSLYNGLHGKTKEEAERYFPELKDEDERIRKWIIGVLSTYEHDGDLRNAALAWLEKQGEQKPQGKSALESIKEEKVDNQNCVKPADKVEPKFSVGDTIKITGINNGHTGFSILNTEDGYYYNWKLVENKSVWSEEDELVIKDIEEAITNYWHGYTQNILLDWLKSLKEKIGG